MRITASLLLGASLLVACARPAATPPRDLTLIAADGASREVRGLVERAPYTVVVFVSAECPCLYAHLKRLRELATTYAARGVQFLAVDSEVGGSPARAKETEVDLELPFPVLVDSGARLAEAFGAEYATYTVVVDRALNVRYHGGIDSDKRKLHDGAVPYLRDALDDLLAGKAPRRTEGKALGCVLRKW